MSKTTNFRKINKKNFKGYTERAKWLLNFLCGLIISIIKIFKNIDFIHFVWSLPIRYLEVERARCHHIGINSPARCPMTMINPITPTTPFCGVLTNEKGSEWREKKIFHL
jgi:hypothetical protein